MTARTPRPPQLSPQVPPLPPQPAEPQPAPFAPIGRIGVTRVGPVIEGGRWPAKAVVGEAFEVSATVFREGHDMVAATAVLIDPEGIEVQAVTMGCTNPGLDTYSALLLPTREGLWHFRVEGWSDVYATWSHHATIKVPAGIDVELVLGEGAQMLRAAASRRLPASVRSTLRAAAKGLTDASRPAEARLAAGTSPQVRAALARYPLRQYVTASAGYPLVVERERALVGAWYEMFPRSVGAHFDEKTGWHSGTLVTAARDLPRIASLGFDVVFLTPIHPIGTTYRKGRNNSLTCRPEDPGSPYAIGSPEGGHDAIHPDLGTFADFDAFVIEAKRLGLEVALDLALQCSPDHPWVTQHPEWFTTRLDGTIAYAENPPKKYQDIYPLNFDNDPEGIYAEILRIIEVWVEHGVTIFRVDNPHTKPLSFWQRLLAEVAELHPEVLFLAEAFTRPAMMQTLAQIGFHQSYCYFAWRNTKAEVEEYLVEVSGEQAAWMRPAFWPTTHDILTPYMQRGGPAAFAIRAVLAATGSPTYGIYSGYEFAENVARPGVEEQIDNEKYEYRPRDFAAPEAAGLQDLLRRLNEIRHEHPALQRLRNLTIHPTSDPETICFSRHLAAAHSPTGRDDTIIVVINLDPHATREALVRLDPAALGLGDLEHGSFVAHDLLSGATYAWGRENYVRLDPHAQCAHVIEVRAW